MTQKTLLLFSLFLAALTLAFPSASFAERDRVDRSERLGLLKTATGGEPTGSSGSFQERLEGILNETPDPSRTYVANEDAQIRQEMKQSFLETNSPSKDIAPVTRIEDVVQDDNKPVDQKINPDIATDKIKASQKDYEESLKEMEQKAAERNVSLLAEQGEEEDVHYPQNEESGNKSKLPPSLANNPFYFAPKDEKTFEDDKPIIISRLVQQGFTALEARNMVSTATSQEELILFLIQEHDFEYGEALELVKTS